MLFKLALRNIKRQFSSYIVYFLSIVSSVSMMFAIINILYSGSIASIGTYDDGLRSVVMKKSCIMAMFMVSVVIAVMQSRAQMNIIKVRKREFGTYMLLGINTSDIVKMYVTETALVFGITTVAGIIAGAGLYMLILPPLANYLELNKYSAEFNPEALFLTIILSALVFLISSLSAAVYLKKTSINKLINNITNKKKKLKDLSLAVSVVILIISVLMFATAIIIILAPKFMDNILSDDSPLVFAVITIIMIIFPPVAMMLFHMSASKCITEFLLRNKKICSKGTNRFLLRQMSSKMISNSSVYGAISVIMFLSVIGFSMTAVAKESSAAIAETLRRYDLVTEGDRYLDSTIEKYAAIEGKILCTEYSSIIPMVTIISEKQANKILELYKKDQRISTNGKCLRIFNDKNTEYAAEPRLSLFGEDLEYGGIIRCPVINELTLIFPDEYMERLEKNPNISVRKYFIYNLEDKKFDARGLYKELYEKKVMPEIKEYYRIMILGEYAPALLVAIYSSILFIIISIALLAQKASSEVNEDKQRYSVLSDIGTGRNELCNTLKKQIGIYFAFPLILPVLSTFAVTKYAATGFGFEDFGNEFNKNVMMSAVFTAGFIIFIYMLYYIITYNLLKNKIILNKEKREI